MLDANSALFVNKQDHQGRRNEMKGAGAKLQNGYFLNERAIGCKLVGSSAPTPPRYVVQNTTWSRFLENSKDNEMKKK